MLERENDDVGTTGDRLGEGASNEAKGEARGSASAVDNSASRRDATTASSPGTIADGESDAELSQAGGGSVD